MKILFTNYRRGKYFSAFFFLWKQMHKKERRRELICTKEASEFKCSFIHPLASSLFSQSLGLGKAVSENKDYHGRITWEGNEKGSVPSCDHICTMNNIRVAFIYMLHIFVKSPLSEILNSPLLFWLQTIMMFPELARRSDKWQRNWIGSCVIKSLNIAMHDLHVFFFVKSKIKYILQKI